MSATGATDDERPGPHRPRQPSVDLILVLAAMAVLSVHLAQMMIVVEFFVDWDGTFPEGAFRRALHAFHLSHRRLATYGLLAFGLALLATSVVFRFRSLRQRQP